MRVRTKTRKPAVFQPRMSKIVAVDFRYAIVVTDRFIIMIMTGEIDFDAGSVNCWRLEDAEA